MTPHPELHESLAAAPPDAHLANPVRAAPTGFFGQPDAAALGAVGAAGFQNDDIFDEPRELDSMCRAGIFRFRVSNMADAPILHIGGEFSRTRRPQAYEHDQWSGGEPEAHAAGNS